MSTIYVNSTWKSGEKITIDGVEYTVGTDAFTSYDGALNYAKNNSTARNATIVMMNNSGVSGNCIDQNTHNGYSNLKVTIQDGAVMGNANSKWDMTYAFTVEAGGVLQSARPASAGYGYTHVKNVMTIGEADAEKQAVVNFINSPTVPYKTMCISVLYNGSLDVTNAIFRVGDLGMIGKSAFTDSTIEVAGSISFAAGTQTCAGKHSMTNSTMTVKGHDLRGDNTYSSADCNRIANLIMDNSTIIIDDGVENTAADVVELGVLKSGFLNSKKELIMQNNSKITVEAGTQINLLYNVSMSDSVIEGGNFNIVSGDLTMAGKSNLDIAVLDIASDKKIVIDNTASIVADALTGTGTIEINVVDAVAGFDKVIDLADGADVTGLIDRISVKQDGYSAIVKDGDIYVASYIYVESGVVTDIAEALAAAEGRVVQISGRYVDVDQATMDAIANGDVKFAVGTMFFLAEGVTTAYSDANLTVKEFGVKADLVDGVVDLTADNAVATGNIGSNDADLTLTTGDAAEGSAEVRADVTGSNVVLENSKELAITGSVSGSNVEINNADDAVLDGGSDDYSAKISADEKITFVNDGHAVVDMSAKIIEIENNSVNTITGSKLEGETVIIDAKENADGVVSETEIIATNVEIADQTVSASKITGRVQITADTSLIDTEATGVVSVGFDKENAADTTLTLGGETTIDTLYVGKEGRENNYKLEVAGEDADVTLNNLYSRTDSEFVVSDKAEVNIGYWQSKGAVLVDNATVNHNGWNMYVYNNDSTSVSKITLKNGAVLNSNNSVGIVLGNKNDSPAAAIGNAELVLEGKSTLNVTNLTLQAEGEVEEVAGEKATTSMTVNDSEVNVAKTLTNNSVINIVMGAEDLSDGVDNVNIDAKTIIGSGTIIIDATKFAGGVDKVINVSDMSEFNVVFKEGTAADGVKMLVNEEGDVFVSDVKAETLYVNANFTGEFGDKVGEGMYLGINAFADFDDAVNALKDNDATIVLLSDAAMTADPAFKLNVISGDGKNYTLKIDSVIDVDAEFAKEINIDAGLFMAYYNNHKVVVNGDLKGGFYNYTGSLTFNNSKITNSYDNSNIGGVVNINGDGTWTVDNPQADNLMFLNVGRTDWLGQGILNLNDTVVKAIQFSIDSNSANAKSQINAVNSTICTVLTDGLFGDMTVGANGEVNLTDSNLYVVGTLTNNGTVTVSGESTLNIAALSGNTIDLLDGAIVKDSTVGGEVFVAGNVTFRGDNTFNMISDFGVLTDYYGTTAPMKWTVEAGASVTLTAEARYGLGYGDDVTINGSIADAKAARAALTDDNIENDVKCSFFSHGIITMESAGWNKTSYFTVNDAYAVIGSNNSFGNKNGNYGGTYYMDFNNAVIDISRFSLYEAKSVSYYTFTDSDVYVSGAFMTADADSVVTLENTNISVNGNGNDVSNTNAGTLNVIDKSNLTYNGQNFVNNGTVLVENSSFTADSFTNNGTVNLTDAVTTSVITNNGEFTVAGESNLNGTFSGKAIKLADGVTLTSTDGVQFENTLNGADATFGKGNFDMNGLYVNSGDDVVFAEGADVDVAGTFAIWDGGTIKVEKGAEVAASSTYFNGGNIEVSGKLSSIVGNDGGFILNGADDTVTINEGGVLDVTYVDIYKTTGNSTVEVYGDAQTSFKLSDGSGKFTWNIYDSGSLNAGKYGIEMNNADSAINVYGDVTAAQISNAGKITVDGGNLNVAGTLTNNGTVTVKGESTVNVATLTGTYIRFEDAVIVGDSNIGGNIRAYDDFTVSADLTCKQANFYGETTIESGVTLNSSNTIAGSGSTLTVENGATINSRFLNAAGGVVEINGAVNLEHSDPRQKLLQVHEGSIANINKDGVVTITRHNAIVNADGTLNVAGTLTITPDTVNVAFDRGGVLYNNGTVVLNETAKVNLKAIAAGEGSSIVINVSDDWQGIAIVIDAADGFKDFGNIVVDEADAAAGVKFKVNEATGDLAVFRVDTETFYVNADWADKGYTFCEEFEEGKYFGVNAFASIDDAVKAADASVSNIIAAAGKDATLHLDVFTENANGLIIDMGNNDLSFDSNGAYVFKGSYDLTGAVGAEIGFCANELTIGKNVTVNADVLWANDNTRNIEGTLNVNAVYVRDQAVNVSGTLDVRDNYVVLPVDGKVATNITESGIFKAANVYVKGEAYNFNIDGKAAVGNFNSQSIVNVDGELSITESAAIAELNLNGVANLSDGVKFNGNLINNGTLNIAGSAFIENLVNNAELSLADKVLVAGTVVNNSIITVNNATLTGDSIVNNGTITVTGESTLSASFSGTAVSVAASAVLNVVNYTFAAGEALINANVYINQIKSVNGLEVVKYAGSTGNIYYYIDKEDSNIIYELTQAGQNVVVDYLGALDDQIDVTITDDGAYTYTIVAEYNGAAEYTLTINGETFTNATGIFTWTGDYAAAYESSFSYNVTVKDIFGREYTTAGTQEVVDVTAPTVSEIVVDTQVVDGVSKTTLNFTVSDNDEGVKVYLNGEYVGGKGEYSLAVGEGIYTVEVKDSNGANNFVYSGLIENPVDTNANGDITISNDSATSEQNKVVIDNEIVTGTDNKDGEIIVDSYTGVEVNGDIKSSNSQSNTIVVGTSAELDVSNNNISDVADFESGAGAVVKAKDYSATADADSFYLGMNGTASFAAVDMQTGDDEIYIGYAAKFEAASVTGTETIKVSRNGIFAATGAVGDVNSLTVGTDAVFSAGTLTGTAGDDSLTFNGNRYAVVGAVDLKGGADTLALKNGANVIFTGSFEAADLTITGNKTCTIFVTGEADFSDAAGAKRVNIVEADMSRDGEIAAGVFELFTLDADSELNFSTIEAGVKVEAYDLNAHCWVSDFDEFSFSGADYSLVKLSSLDGELKNYTLA